MTASSKVHTAHQQLLAGQYEAAAESLSAVEDYASSYIVRTEVLLAMGEIEQALAAVKEALERCPNSPRGILLLESIGRIRPQQTAPTQNPVPTLSDLFDDELAVIEPAVLPTPTKLEDTSSSMVDPEPPTVLTEDDAPGLISETLAKLMVKQGKFAEARKVYIQLSRKYPERYEYFRRQMDELGREQAASQ